MPLPLRCVVLLLLLYVLPSSSTCYFPNGAVSDDVPCNPTAEQSVCCSAGQWCLDSKLCQDSRYQDDGGRFLRGGCTDLTWGTDACPHFCLNEYSSGDERVYNCGNGKFCCDDRHCCDNANSQFFQLGQQIVATAMSGAVHNPTSAPASTQQSNPSSAPVQSNPGPSSSNGGGGASSPAGASPTGNSGSSGGGGSSSSSGGGGGGGNSGSGGSSSSTPEGVLPTRSSSGSSGSDTPSHSSGSGSGSGSNNNPVSYVGNTATLIISYSGPTTAPTTIVSDASGSNHKTKDDKARILGLAIGIAVGVVLLAIVVALWLRHQKQVRQRQPPLVEADGGMIDEKYKKIQVVPYELNAMHTPIEMEDVNRHQRIELDATCMPVEVEDRTKNRESRVEVRGSWRSGFR